MVNSDFVNPIEKLLDLQWCTVYQLWMKMCSYIWQKPSRSGIKSSRCEVFGKSFYKLTLFAWPGNSVIILSRYHLPIFIYVFSQYRYAGSFSKPNTHFDFLDIRSDIKINKTFLKILIFQKEETFLHTEKGNFVLLNSQTFPMSPTDPCIVPDIRDPVMPDI
jgi:hypothetical protein